MKCLACGSSSLFAYVTITRAIPLSDRNGTLNMAGVTVKQSEIKAAWDEHAIRGPIVCSDCAQQHFYLVGGKKTLHKGDVNDARDIGSEDLIAADRKIPQAAEKSAAEGEADDA